MTVKTTNVHKSLDFLNLGILKNWQLQVLNSDPATTYARIYQRSTDGKIRQYNSFTNAWEDVGSSVSDEYIQDLIAAMFVAGNNIDITYNDGSATITVDVEGLTSGDISDFDTQVRLSRLDQMAAPTGSLSLNGQKITDLGTPTTSTDAATKAYVDATASGIDWKASVRVATTAAGTLASSFENGDTVDGVVLATGDRILIKNQATASENGIYTVNASGAPTRSTDADANAEVTSGVAVFVEEGTTNADTGWMLTTDGDIVVGTTNLTFTQFTSLGQVSAGAGLTKTGSTLDVGAGTGISVAADTVSLDTAVAVRKFVSNIGDNATADIVVTHNLNTRDVTVAVVDAGSPYSAQDVYWEATTVNTITIFFVSAPATDAYRVVIHG